MTNRSGSGSPGQDEPTARIACEELFLDFHRHIDGGAATRALDLFGDDAILEVRGQRHEGRAAIARFLEARQADTGRHTRHLASNFRFVRQTPTRAQATANLTLFTAAGDGASVLALEAVVDCQLEFIWAGGEWRISARRHVRFATPAV